MKTFFIFFINILSLLICLPAIICGAVIGFLAALCAAEKLVKFLDPVYQDRLFKSNHFAILAHLAGLAGWYVIYILIIK